MIEWGVGIIITACSVVCLIYAIVCFIDFLSNRWLRKNLFHINSVMRKEGYTINHDGRMWFFVKYNGDEYEGRSNKNFPFPMLMEIRISKDLNNSWKWWCEHGMKG